MYVGHASIALFAKSRRSAIPLALLLPVAWGPDWVEVCFSALHHENRMLSHSLVAVGIVATASALAYFAYTRKAVDALVIWLVYVSHWPADYLTGLKPTWPGGPTVGLQLYGRPYIDFAMEGSLILIASYFYWRSLPPLHRKRAAMFLIPLGLLAFQIGFEAINTNPDFA